MALPSPSPFSLPLLSLTYITRQLTPKGTTWGLLFAPPHFGPMCKWPQMQRNWGGAILGKPHFGPLWFTCPFLQFWTPEHQRTNWTTLTPTDIQPIVRKTTYFGSNLNWTRSLASPLPTMGAIYTKETQPMARESYTSCTLVGSDPPHRGGDRPPPSPLHHEAKE